MTPWTLPIIEMIMRMTAEMVAAIGILVGVILLAVVCVKEFKDLL